MEMPNNKSRNDRPVEDEYLWDASGTPDPQVQKLETLLAKYRLPKNAVAPELPQAASTRRQGSFRRRLFPVLAAAAAAALIITFLVTFLVTIIRKQSPAMPTTAGWDVSSVSGNPQIESKSIPPRNASSRLGIGQLLETDLQSRASLQSADTGEIEIEPGTRLRLLSMTAGRKHIALERGTIHAHIWAPAGEFVVDTPSATTVDLGCAYTLQVDDSGAGLVRTSLGWVGFKLNGHESFIPAGAACATRPKVGPGTPYFEDTRPELREALGRFDFEDTTAQQRAHDLEIVLARSRPQDALTLWHLLSRVDAGQRARVFDRLAASTPPPANVTRAGILALDQSMLDQWWNSLGYDDISVWRRWEHSWSAPSK
jgi:hypothetical protein